MNYPCALRAFFQTASAAALIALSGCGGGSATVKAPDVDTYTSFTANSLTSSNPNYTFNAGTVSASITKARLEPGFVWLSALVNYSNIKAIVDGRTKATCEREDIGCMIARGSLGYFVSMFLGDGDVSKSLDIFASTKTSLAKGTNITAAMISSTIQAHSNFWKFLFQMQLDAVGMGKNYEVNDDDIRAWVKGLIAP